jgi:hypothetical protein
VCAGAAQPTRHLLSRAEAGRRPSPTIGIRFDALPQWLSRLGLVLGGLLGVTGAFAGPLDFLFPVWLTVVSLTLLFARRRRRGAG